MNYITTIDFLEDYFKKDPFYYSYWNGLDLTSKTAFRDKSEEMLEELQWLGDKSDTAKSNNHYFPRDYTYIYCLFSTTSDEYDYYYDAIRPLEDYRRCVAEQLRYYTLSNQLSAEDIIYNKFQSEDTKIFNTNIKTNTTVRFGIEVFRVGRLILPRLTGY